AALALDVVARLAGRLDRLARHARERAGAARGRRRVALLGAGLLTLREVGVVLEELLELLLRHLRVLEHVLVHLLAELLQLQRAGAVLAGLLLAGRLRVAGVLRHAGAVAADAVAGALGCALVTALALAGGAAFLLLAGPLRRRLALHAVAHHLVVAL